MCSVNVEVGTAFIIRRRAGMLSIVCPVYTPHFEASTWAQWDQSRSPLTIFHLICPGSQQALAGDASKAKLLGENLYIINPHKPPRRNRHNRVLYFFKDTVASFVTLCQP